MKQKTKYWNIFLIISLICLLTISFNKPKKNKLFITVKPLEGFYFNNPRNINKDVANNMLTKNLISANTKNNFTLFYLNQKKIDKIKNIHKNVKIINKYQYYLIIIDYNQEKNLEENFNKIKMIIEDYSKKIILKNAQKLYEHFEIDYQRMLSEKSNEQIKDSSFELIELKNNIEDIKIIIQDIKNNNIKFIQVTKS